ncbi:putative magnesium or manganese-dependent protein phosphatase [Actinacidiphila reveromycinica]|uniref:protein-serine/threonine phosphatase n=1 Tax=Actinacidiphila reveromycinica TaxID=659352 RepID=A0A7U3UNI6_9ACTN|nr:SpoIIE family protein phosphatase [Streptomyces sp. SN-593]BBA95785.1 putative magnesium or manganese-dependent protein phosphatase [Streptomyces sp. SN-593]
MGGARDNPAEHRDDDAELRQIEALNRLRANPSAGPDPAPGASDASPAPGSEAAAGPAPSGHPSGPPSTSRPQEPHDPHAGPGGPDALPPQDAPGTPRGPGGSGVRDAHGPADAPVEPAPAARTSPRHRDALLVDTGHTVADAQSLDEALKALTALRAPSFPLDGQAVFGIDGTFLTKLATLGFRAAGPERIFRMPLATGYPATEVVRTGRPVFLATADEYRRRFPVTYPLTAHKGRMSWAFLPLTASGRLSGVWLAAFRSPVAFTEDERTLLTVTARLLAQALERTRVGEAEIALSRGLRSSMGRAGPAIRGLSVATRYVPTGGGLMVGGDWFDSIELPSGRLALVIGDVQGHDVHAASLMTQLRTAVHAYAAEGHGPDAVLARASRFLTALDEDRFATCVYIEADPGTGLLQVARAGHPHPVLRLPDGTCMLKHVPGGLPLGLMPGGEDYPVTLMQLHEQEVLMLCTDGLIETGGYDMYSGWVRVRDAMSPGPGEDLEGMADRLIEAVSGPPHPGGRARPEPDLRHTDVRARNEDDIALLLVRRDSGAPLPDLRERRLVLAIEQGRGQDLSEARAELESLLHDWARPDQVDTAVLLASELVGNVLMHTDQSAALVAVVSGEPGRRTLTVEVTDRGDELPHQRAPGELASSGRGLVLLDLLADEWSVQPEAEGKTVWFSLSEDADPQDAA